MSGNGDRILAVAGDGAAGERLRALGAGSGGYTVECVAGAAQARAAAAASPPHFVLVQDRLPDGTAAGLVRGQGALARIPLAVVSDDPAAPEVRDALEAGALDCLAPGELSAENLPAIAARLRRAARESAARRQAQAERDEYRRRLDTITGILGVGFAVISQCYRIRWTNGALREVFGEVAGAVCYEAFHRSADICPGCGVQEVFDRRADRVVREQRHYDAAGRPVWFEVVAAPVRDAGGALTEAMELFVPLTERKRTEERLARHLEHERLLAEVAAAAVRTGAPERFQEECVALLSRALDVSRIYVFEHRDATDTMDNTVEWVAAGVSHERERLQGVPAAAIPWWMGHLRADRVVSCADIEEIPSEGEKAILRSQGIRAVLAVPLFVGERYFGFLGFDECRGPRPWLPEDVELLRTVASFLSIMLERRQAEAEREALIGELRSRNEALDQFTYTVSHDLKGPLTTVRGFAGLVEQDAREGRPDRVRDYARQIGAAAERMQRLLDDLLGLSRIGRITHAPVPVPLLEVAREAAASFAVQAAEQGVEVEIAPDLPVVRGDPTRLREVLENLLGNALKFLGDQPRPAIWVGWRPDADRPVFYVRDNGIGISPEQHERIFGLFEKLDIHSSGTGIGLAIVKRIVEVHGGRVWVESEGPGTGSTFCFTLGEGASSYLDA